MLPLETCHCLGLLPYSCDVEMSSTPVVTISLELPLVIALYCYNREAEITRAGMLFKVHLVYSSCFMAEE